MRQRRVAVGILIGTPGWDRVSPVDAAQARPRSLLGPGLSRARASPGSHRPRAHASPAENFHASWAAGASSRAIVASINPYGRSSAWNTSPFCSTPNRAMS